MISAQGTLVTRWTNLQPVSEWYLHQSHLQLMLLEGLVPRAMNRAVDRATEH